jgi:flagellar protein FlaG
MNTINPQAAPSGVQHNQRRGIERTDSSEYSPSTEPKATVNETVKATVNETAHLQESKESRQLEVAVARLNDYVQSVERDLRFSLDRESGQPVISVFDRKTSELIRQIPPEITLSLAQQLNSDEPLLLFSAQV